MAVLETPTPVPRSVRKAGYLGLGEASDFLVLVPVVGQDESAQSRRTQQRVADLIPVLIGHSPQVSASDWLSGSCERGTTWSHTQTCIRTHKHK